MQTAEEILDNAFYMEDSMAKGLILKAMKEYASQAIDEYNQKCIEANENAIRATGETMGAGEQARKEWEQTAYFKISEELKNSLK